MDNKMTAEQALEHLHKLCWNLPANDEHAAHELIDFLRQALSAQRVPDGARSTIDEAASHLKNWLEMDLCDCEGSHHCGYYDVKRTRDALLSILAASPEPVAIAEPYCKDCQYAGMLHCSDPVNCGNGAIVPDNLRRQTNTEQHAQLVIADLRAEVEALKLELHNVHVDRALAESEVEALKSCVAELEEQWAVVFDGHAVMQRMESDGQYAHPPLICATLDAVAKIGKERAARLREGGDQ